MMRPNTFLLAVGFAATLALASVAAAAAPPQLTETSDKYVLANDVVQVWLEGKAPSLRVVPVGADASGGFTYRLMQLVEYRDINGDGQLSQGEAVAALNLSRADFHANRTDAADAVTLNLTLADNVTLVGTQLPAATPGLPLPVDREANVSLVFTLRSDAQTVALGALDASIPATSVQYDLLVAKWPFVDAVNDRLALEAVVGGVAKDAKATGLDTATVTAANGTALGSLSWATSAQGTTSAGAALPVPVKTVASAEGNATRIVQTYDAPGLAALAHAHTAGLTSATTTVTTGVHAGESVKPAPGPGLVLAVGAVGVTAYALRRR